MNDKTTTGRSSDGALIPTSRWMLRTGFLTLAIFAGAFSGIYWLSGPGPRAGKTDQAIPAESGLSASTLAVLKNLPSTVEVRYYSILDPNTVSDATQSFARRVHRILALVENASNGKLQIVAHTSADDRDPGVDGVQSFNNDKGDACFLGIALEAGGQKEVLPLLLPEWEQAFEFDFARALARLANRAPVASPYSSLAQAAPASPGAQAQLPPELAHISVEQGGQLLRESALQDFRNASGDFEAKLAEAEKLFAEARKNGSDAEQIAAREVILRIQSEQAAKLKEIAMTLQTDMAELQRVKGPLPAATSSRQLPTPSPIPESLDE